MIQALSGNTTCPESWSASDRTCPATLSRTFPAEVQHSRTICGLRRANRREQGLQGAVRLLSDLLQRGRRPALARAGRQLAAADSRASADPASGFSGRCGQVRRDGGVGSADHAVVLREPVDGGARSVGARQAGAGQRQVRRAEGPVHPQQRRAVLREVRRSSPRRCSAIEQQSLAQREPRPQRPAVLPRALRLAGDRAEVSRDARAALEEHAGPSPAAGLARSTTQDCPPAGCVARFRRPGQRIEPRAAAEPAPSTAALRLRRSARQRHHRAPHQRGRGGHRDGRRSASADGRRFIRCSRRSGMATPSATKCSASSACCGGRLRVGHLRRDGRLAARTADPRLSRARRCQPSRQSAAAPFFDRIQGVANGLRPSRPDGAHLPQHHAAGVFRRRASHARAPVLPRPARAAGLRRPLRSRAGRLGVQPPGSRSARFSAHRRAPGRARLLAPRSRAELASSPTSSTTTGPTSCSSAGSSPTRRSKI